MAESFLISPSLSRTEQYNLAKQQLKALVQGESDRTANLCNIMACLKYGFGFFWVGIYEIKDDVLVLGPFQGPLACTRIPKGKGVCGKSWERNETLLVPNVEEFPSHIACSSESKSEVVVPLRNNKNEVIGVFDIDSDKINDFTEEDKLGLEKIGKLISEVICN